MHVAENPDLEVESIWVQGNYEQQLLTMIAGGTPPDVMMISSGSLANFADQFIVLEDIDTSAYAQEYSVNAMSIDGELYVLFLILQSQRCWALIVGAFNAAGVELPSMTEPLTAEEYQEIAIALTSGEGDDRLFGSADLWFGQWLYVFGGSFFNEDGTQFTVDSPEAIAAANFLDAAVNEYNYAPNVIQRDGIDRFGWFILGRMAMWPDFGPWFLPRMYEAEDLEWDVLPVPSFNADVEINGLAVGQDASDPECCIATRPLYGSEVILLKQSLATTPGLAVPVTVVGQQAFVESDPDHNLGAFLVNIENAQPTPQTCMDTAIWGEFYGALFDQSTIYGGDSVPEEFLVDRAAYINSEFACE